INLMTEVDPDVSPIEVDPAEFELALLNVGLNARDAMPNGGTLRISARNVPAGARIVRALEGRFVAITVSDTGTGIPEEIRNRVIEPFFTTKGAGKGSGLGLSQAYGFAIQSGGSMTVESTLGKGTAITFYLPVADSLPAAAIETDSAQLPQGRGRVLVVEDDPRVAELAVGLLEDAGYTARLVDSAQSAIDALERHEVDAGFSDIMLPGGMNGAELAQFIRAQFPGVGILLATGYAESGTNRLAQEFPLIAKPYDQSSLIGAMAKVMREAH